MIQIQILGYSSIKGNTQVGVPSFKGIGKLMDAIVEVGTGFDLTFICLLFIEPSGGVVSAQGAGKFVVAIFWIAYASTWVTTRVENLR